MIGRPHGLPGQLISRAAGSRSYGRLDESGLLGGVQGWRTFRFKGTPKGGTCGAEDKEIHGKILPPSWCKNQFDSLSVTLSCVAKIILPGWGPHGQGTSGRPSARGICLTGGGPRCSLRAASQTILTPNATGLHLISPPASGEAVADIVFVHGLGGKSHDTWRHGKKDEDGHFFWPEELRQELPECNVWSVGYEAGIIPWFGADGLPIEDRAVNLAHKLTTPGLGARPLIFITHSMGGLMVKEIVVQSLTAGDDAWSSLVSQIAGIVFCGTPHRGADVARMARRLAGVLRTQHHIQDMAAGTRHLERLHSRFVEWHRQHQPKTEAYAEGIGMKRQHWFLRWLPAVFAVKPGSADPQLAGCRCIPCHCDHLELVKPGCREDDVFAGVRKFIAGILPAVQTASPPSPVLPGPSLSNLSDSAIQTLFDVIFAEAAIRQLDCSKPSLPRKP